jgi:hypothetical protein
MWVSVLYEGVPIGTGHLTVDVGSFRAELDALPGYAPIHAAVEDAWRAIANFGYLPPADATVGGVTPEGDAAGGEAINHQYDIETALELRDVHGNVLAAHEMSLFDEGERFTICGSLGTAPAHSSAVRTPPPRSDDGHASPNA